MCWTVHFLKTLSPSGFTDSGLYEDKSVNSKNRENLILTITLAIIKSYPIINKKYSYLFHKIAIYDYQNNCNIKPQIINAMEYDMVLLHL